MTMTVAKPPRAGMRRRRVRDVQGSNRLAGVLLSPTFLVLALVVGFPVIAAFRQSLFQQSQSLDAQGFIVQGEKFVGFKNYTTAFSGANSDAFWTAFWNTTFFTVTTVTIETVLGVAMALIMHHAFRGRGLVRASILVPWAIPTAVSGILWRWIFQADGVANAILGRQVLWTTEGFHAKVAVIAADTWKTAPFIGLLVLAGLQVIPQEIFEAAKVDGAGAWQQFLRITLPLVKPALLVAVLFRLLDVLRIFDLPFVLIGPRKASVETLTMLAWDDAINLHYGSAAAYATILFLYVAVIAYVFVRVLGADIIADFRQRPKTPRPAKPRPLTRHREVTA